MVTVKVDLCVCGNVYQCIFQGLWYTTVTPCVDILKDHLHADYEGISSALAAKSGAIIFGSVIGGYLADKFQV